MSESGTEGTEVVASSKKAKPPGTVYQAARTKRFDMINGCLTIHAAHQCLSICQRLLQQHVIRSHRRFTLSPLARPLGIARTNVRSRRAPILQVQTCQPFCRLACRKGRPGAFLHATGLPPLNRSNAKRTHHLVVLVLDDMAMPDELTGSRRTAHESPAPDRRSPCL